MTAHGNAGSLTHWARPGIEPATSWFLAGFVNYWATTGPPLKYFKMVYLALAWLYSLVVYKLLMLANNSPMEFWRHNFIIFKDLVLVLKLLGLWILLFCKKIYISDNLLGSSLHAEISELPRSEFWFFFPLITLGILWVLSILSHLLFGSEKFSSIISLEFPPYCLYFFFLEITMIDVGTSGLNLCIVLLSTTISHLSVLFS